MSDRPHWTTLNLAGLWLAVAAAESQRTGLVALPDVGGPSPLRVLLQATDGGVRDEPDVLEAAVVYERIDGASWAELEDVLGSPAAHLERRFAPRERSFRLAEAFPGMLREDAPEPAAGAAVLSFPDASVRWLVTALRRRGVAVPRLTVADATWRRHEEAAVALMETALRHGELPDDVDLLAARFDLEHRRVGLLVAGLGDDASPSRVALDAVDQGVRAGDVLAQWARDGADVRADAGVVRAARRDGVRHA